MLYQYFGLDSTTVTSSALLRIFPHVIHLASVCQIKLGMDFSLQMKHVFVGDAKVRIVCLTCVLRFVGVALLNNRLITRSLIL